MASFSALASIASLTPEKTWSTSTSNSSHQGVHLGPPTACFLKIVVSCHHSRLVDNSEQEVGWIDKNHIIWSVDLRVIEIERSSRRHRRVGYHAYTRHAREVWVSAMSSVAFGHDELVSIIAATYPKHQGEKWRVRKNIFGVLTYIFQRGEKVFSTMMSRKA